MTKKSIMNAVSFRYALLDSYKKMNIQETELAVLLMIDHLLEQGNTYVTSDMLSLKMNLSVSEIDKTMESLMSRGLLSIDFGHNGLKTSIDGLKDKVYAQFKKEMEYESANQVDSEREKTLQELNALFEEKFQQTLSPLDRSVIASWLASGFKKDDIKDSLLDAVSSHKNTVKAVDRILKSKRREDDFLKEGYSASSGPDDTWDKDIQETIALGKKMWGSDD